jgi:hypothetical protein
VNEFPKKNAEIFKQTHPLNTLRTFTTGSHQNIPNWVGRTFKPTYSGTYKLEISMNWGGVTIDNLGARTNVAVQKGVFKLEFARDPDELIPSHTWSARLGWAIAY